MTKENPILKFYNRFKLELVNENVKDFLFLCPFCPEEEVSDKGTYSVHKEKGTHRCFKCGNSGNINTFMTDFHAKWLSETEHEHYLELAKVRGLNAKVIKLAKLAYNSNWEYWLVPYKRNTKQLRNLGVVHTSGKFKYKVLKPSQIEPGNPSSPLLAPYERAKLKDEVWVFEGLWDLLAAKAALLQGGVKQTPSLVSTDGASTWTEEMNKDCSNRSVTFFWDNDKAGQDTGPKAILKRISGCTPQFINWPENLELKDIRDLWTTRKERNADVSLELLDLAANASLPEDVTVKKTSKPEGFSTNVAEIDPIPTYSQFQETLSKYLYINDAMRRSYDICLASCLSINLPDKPLWVLLIGQASTGKSTLIESFGGSSDYFEYTSKLTAESFVSGYKGEEDISLIQKVIGKSLMIGDLTVILNLPLTVQEKLWGLLREAYGGTLKIAFGNQKAKEYHDYKFNMIAGVTHAIYAVNNSDMGERFIKIDFAGRHFDEDAHMQAAMAIQDNWPEVKEILKRNLVGYYKHLQETIDFSKPIAIDEAMKHKIGALAKLTTKLRTKVQKDRFEGIISRPHAESPARFATQLITLGKCLAWVIQEEKITTDIFKSLQKVAYDSCPGFGLEVVLYIHKKGEATITGLSRDLGIPKTRIQQITTDFRSLDILEFNKVNNGTGNRGRKVMKFKLTDSVKAALNSSTSKKPTKRKPIKRKPLRRSRV